MTDTGEPPVLTVHILPSPTCRTGAVGHQRMHDDRIAGLDRPHGLADVLDPARILVAEHIRQGAVHLCSPDPLHNVQVRATEPGAANADDHIVRCLYLGVG